MDIEIEYESSWRNSFLQGSNNEPLPKGGRKYIGSMTELNSTKEDNYISRDVTLDTVMGVLNRLIGDQRKLYQSRGADTYYFHDIENLVSWKDTPIVENQEVTYIRNTKGSNDQNSFTGMLKTTSPAFTFGGENELWGILYLDHEKLREYIISGNLSINSEIKHDPLGVINRLDTLNKEKPIEISKELLTKLKKLFPEVSYLDNKNKIKPISLYCSALYIAIDNLRSFFDFGAVLSKNGNLTGISKKGYTKKDFMNAYTTGAKKLIWGNPYVKETMVKGEGKIKSLLTKASGNLSIKIDIPLEQAKELREMIDSAAVSSFYLGKKGIAYVTKITI